jgi:hypothetical protein
MRLFIFFNLIFFTSFSQETKTIHGYLTSDKTGEKLMDAMIFDTVHKQGTVTNEYGFFSLTIPNELVVLKISSFGFESILKEISLEVTEVNVILNEIKELNEVVITSGKRSVESTNIGTMELSIDKVDKLPVFMGEKDVLKILQLMPGVKSGGEGSSGIYVRGGGPDQNLILLDGVPVYNASHLFGFFSVFNSDALSQVTLTKGAFPARYGGRVSSVLDMRMKEGNNQKFNVEGSIGVIASRLLIEGPIKKGKTAFIVSARRTYIDALVKPFLKADNKGGYYFYDLNAKVNHEINKNHHLYLSGYFGQDKASFTSKSNNSDDIGSSTYKSKAGLDWGNAIGAMRWNYKITPKLFSNTTVNYSKYMFQIYEKSENEYNQNGVTANSSNSFVYFSGINDWTGKIDLTYLPNPNHNIKFGIGDIYHTFKPGVTTMSYNNGLEDFSQAVGSKFQYAHELSAYVEDEHKISNRLKANYGIHHSSFFVGKKQYNQLQPRISANYILTENSSLKFGYSRNAQFLHLLTNAGIGLPTDLWVPATERIAPVTADQVSVGYNHDIKRKYNFVLEGYYKKMDNIIQYKEGSSFFSEDTDWQNKVEVGQGWAYGGEIMLEKKKGKLTGWIGYTLSWSERQFDNINFGVKFPYKYDRRHDLSVVMTYEINKTWDLGMVFVYGTGNAITLPTQNYTLAPNSITSGNYFYNQQIAYATSINNYRMPSYHRMDVSANRTRQKKWGETVLSISIYNIYSRQNAFFLFIEQDGTKTKLMQTSLFPIIPSISWKFKIDFEKVKQNKLNLSTI